MFVTSIHPVPRKKLEKCRLYSRSLFANVKLSNRSHEKVNFRFGFSIDSYAKIQDLGKKRYEAVYSHLKIVVFGKNISLSH